MLKTVIRRFSAEVSACKTFEYPRNTREQQKLRDLFDRIRPTHAELKENNAPLPITVASFLATQQTKSSYNEGNDPQIINFKRRIGVKKSDRSSVDGLDHGKLQDLYADANSNSPHLKINCAGCAAPLHCNVPGTPGFIPYTFYDSLVEAMRNERVHRGKAVPSPLAVCIRCVILNRHAHALEVSFDADQYAKLTVSHLQTEENAVILLLADMVNLPHCLVPILGPKLTSHRYVLIGNKVDQLPMVSTKESIEQWKLALIEAVVTRSAISSESIIDTFLVSALTGYGIQSLIDFLLSRRFPSKSPVYLVGCTNVGKSSLFNRLLMSDFCKSQAREAIHRANVSIWPGTTAGLLKFPITQMNTYKRITFSEAKFKNAHQKVHGMEFPKSLGFRYLKAQPVPILHPDLGPQWANLQEKVHRNLPTVSDMTTYSGETSSSSAMTNPSGVSVEASGFDLDLLYRKYLPGGVSVDQATWAGDKGPRLLTSLVHPRHFDDRAWCFDTPGLVSPDQTMNLLTMAELRQVESLKTPGSAARYEASSEKFSGRRLSRVIVPRTFILRPGLSLLLGRMARLDVVHAPGAVYLTSFSVLPVHIVPLEKVEEYTVRFAAHLGPGSSGQQQLTGNRPLAETTGSRLPAFSDQYFMLAPTAELSISCADVVLSGAGWVGVAALASGEEESGAGGVRPQEVECAPTGEKPTGGSEEVWLRAWTPGGLGIHLRQPALIPDALRRRGKRLPWMREFAGLSSK